MGGKGHRKPKSTTTKKTWEKISARLSDRSIDANVTVITYLSGGNGRESLPCSSPRRVGLQPRLEALASSV